MSHRVSGRSKRVGSSKRRQILEPDGAPERDLQRMERRRSDRPARLICVRAQLATATE